LVQKKQWSSLKEISLKFLTWQGQGPGLAFEMLEPCAGKLACTVLRGLGVSNGVWLPGSELDVNERLSILSQLDLSEVNTTNLEDSLGILSLLVFDTVKDTLVEGGNNPI
jgi:hypothetical protein